MDRTEFENMASGRTAPLPRRLMQPQPGAEIHFTEQPAVTAKGGAAVWSGSPSGDQRAFVDAALRKTGGPVIPSRIVNRPDFTSSARGVSVFGEHRLRTTDASAQAAVASIISSYTSAQAVWASSSINVNFGTASNQWFDIADDVVTFSSICQGRYRVSCMLKVQFIPSDSSATEFKESEAEWTGSVNGINAWCPIWFMKGMSVDDSGTLRHTLFMEGFVDCEAEDAPVIGVQLNNNYTSDPMDLVESQIMIIRIGSTPLSSEFVP